MKNRELFVANSSSSSFIIRKLGLSVNKLSRIRLLIDFINSMGGMCGASETTTKFVISIDHALACDEVVSFFINEIGVNVESIDLEEE